MLKMGISSIYGISQKDHDPYIWNRLPNSCWNLRMKQIIWTCLPCHVVRTSLGKLRIIPIQASAKVEIKKVNLFLGSGQNTRMLNQVVIQGGRATPLGSDNNKMRYSH